MAADRRSARLGMLGLVAVMLVGALGTRLWFLQTVQAVEYQEQVDAAKTRTVYIPPERGRIFDADGRVLADNQRILTVTMEWSRIRNRPQARAELFGRLAGPLGVSSDVLEERYQRSVRVDDPLLPMPIAEGVDEATVTFLLERREDFPGIGVAEQWRRVYPYAPLASHVVGYMGAITADTLDSYLAKGYLRNERVGQFGVELSMESELHGEWGKQVWEIDAGGNTVRLIEEVEPVAGYDLKLSIDLDVQQYAEQALQTSLRQRRNLPEDMAYPDRAARNPIDPDSPTGERIFASSEQYGDQEWVQYEAPAGSVVVVDHSDGRVLAMASYPTFDSRWFNAGISAEKFEQLFPSTDDPGRSILVNRAVQGRYNIGSTIKPFIAYSAMHSGVVGPTEIYQDEGTYRLSSIDDATCELVKCVYRNAIDPFGQPSRYGPVTVEEALAVSSDAYFYRIGEIFYTLPGRRDELKADLELFGFGSDSGIDLPFEWEGRIPDDAVKKELVRRGVLAEGEAEFLVTGDLVQVSIGQGLFAATPLQVAMAYATLANEGQLMRPRVVEAVLEPFTPDAAPGFADLSRAVVVRSYARPEVRLQLEMPPEVHEPIIRGLSRVITGPGVRYPATRYRATTGERLFRSYRERGIPIAGKTGTAQGAGNYPWNDSSAFGAFSLDPQTPVTVFAYLEKSGYGSKAAAPVTKCIFGALSGVEPLSPVVPAEPLDVNSPYVAVPQALKSTACLGGYDASVRE